MKEIFHIIANIINDFHELFIVIAGKLGLELSDKSLHFWTIGIFGIVTFLIILLFFTWIAKWKWGITAISFLYTLSLLVVLSFAIEIQQGLTGEGNMEWMDIQIGLVGFLLFFGLFLFISIGVTLIRSLSKKKKEKSKRVFNQ